LGTEAFDTVVQGESVIEHPKPGEVVWCDDAGVTCRRWNWRQGQRTQLTADTTDALFILDTLDPLGEFEREALVTDLVMWLELLGSTEVVTKTLMRV
jgi:DNA/RNA-binding domain of Phe-tRNA-synthetase-like protein